MAKNVYIHIPFCRGKYRGKCNYCSFISFDKLDLKSVYLEALRKQIIAEYKGEKLNTLYFGGGTPSLLTIEEFKNLLDLFNFEDCVEITVEVNPDDINLSYLQGLKKIGINRISIGAQTFNENTLKIIGRRHSSFQIKNAVNCAKNAGFVNVSLDLIYGLPNQEVKDFENDLHSAIDLDLKHISLYGLKIEDGCYFYKNPPQRLPNLDVQADMYLKAIEILKEANFNHYEISNFAKMGFESQHNLNYWNANTYYGFGCAASGYIDDVRYTNEIELEEYIESPFSKISKQRLTDQLKLEETIFLGFRKSEGINIEEINQKFGINFNEKYSKILKKYPEFFIKTLNGYTLSIEGILISNNILSEFIEL